MIMFITPRLYNDTILLSGGAMLVMKILSNFFDGTRHCFDRVKNYSGGPFIGSLESQQDINKAVDLLKNGGLVVSQMHGVFGIWIDASNRISVKNALTVKGTKDLNKPLSSMMPTELLLQYVDTTKIHYKLITLFKSTESFATKLGAMCHIRVPVKNSSYHTIPKSLLSKDKTNTYYLHNLDPYGHEGMNNFVRASIKKGVSFVGVTSLGKSGSPEIDNLNDAISFCKKHSKLPLLLKDDTLTKENVRGSFAIIDLVKLEAIRDGFIPIKVIEKIIDLELDKKNMKATKYNQLDFNPILELNLSPDKIRLEVISHLKNHL